MSVMTARARLRLMLASIHRPAATASSANVPSHHEASSQAAKVCPRRRHVLVRARRSLRRRHSRYPLCRSARLPCLRTHGPRNLTRSAADHAARAAGMPFGGGFLSSHTGLEVAMIAPVEETTCVRRKLSVEVFTACVIWPPASWVAV
jgi:hypothetical protein